MKRAVLILAILGLYPSFAQQKLFVRDDFTYNAASFEVEWDVFVRKLFGCPLDKAVSYKDDCEPGKGYIDDVAYEKARNKAKIFFKLKD